MWEGDLLQYQLYSLSHEQLLSKKLISEGRILSIKDNKIDLQLNQRDVGWLGGYDEFIIIRFGTLFCGKREKARLLEINKGNNSIVLQVFNQEGQYFPDAIIFPVSSDIPPPIFQEPPSFLKSVMQRGLLRIQKSGAIKPDKARQRSIIQLMEGVFGRKKIKRGTK